MNLKESDFDSDRCWVNGAWTLQETSEKTIIGRDTGDDRAIEDDIQRRLREELSLLRKLQGAENVFHALLGLAYLLGSVSIPAYYEKQSEEDAWTVLIPSGTIALCIS